MIVNRKLDRFKQWGKERMGSEAKTVTSTEFKALETEMQLRHDGTDRMKKSADVYIRTMAKSHKFDEKEMQIPIAYFGSTMVKHSDELDQESQLGQCLGQLGRANERIARIQENYCTNATGSWLESLERSLIQLKDYQNARKRLENRRLAYDAASTKLQKSKKEDSRLEEDVRAQKMKYEESNEDVLRRMLDIREAEAESVGDLSAFLDAQLDYYERCRDVLQDIKRNWPASQTSAHPKQASGPDHDDDLPVRRGSVRFQANVTKKTIATGDARDRYDAAPNQYRKDTAFITETSASGSPHRDVPRPMERSLSTNALSHETGYRQQRPFPIRNGLDDEADGVTGHNSTRRLPMQPKRVVTEPLRLSVDRCESPSSSTSSFAAAQQYCEQMQAHMLKSRNRSPASSIDGGISSASSEVGEALERIDSGRSRVPPPPPPRKKRPPPPPPVRQATLLCAGAGGYH